MAVAEVFRALGDPVRLEMVQRLTKSRRSTISDISADLGVTRQGARKHLQVLVNANLVVLEPQGRDVIVRLEPDALEGARSFIAQIERQWENRLQALKHALE